MNRSILIPKKESQHILVISEDINGKGGVSIVVKKLLDYYEVVHYIPSTARVNIISKVIVFIKCIYRIICSFVFNDIRIVHIHSASYGSFLRKSIIIYLSKIFGKKIILHIHSGHFSLFYDKWNKLNIIKYTLNIPDTLIVLTESWKVFFSSIVDSNRIKVLNNLIPYPSRELATHHQDRLVLLFLGILNDNKGIFDLLSVIAENKNLIADKILLNIGGIGDIDRLKKTIYTNGLEDCVFYSGWVDEKAKNILLNESDIYILPSYNEGLPISILESMSYALPIISTNVGGIPSIVKDHYNGLLVNPGNKTEILESLLFFINNRDQIKLMGNNGLDIVKHFYPNSVIPSLSLIYKNLLS